MRIFRRLLDGLWHLPRNIAVFFVKAYQRTLSPDHGAFKGFFPHGYCKFHPTCSEYAKESFKKYGIVYGGLKSFWRVCRCNPWSKGGEDHP